jgi:hypothetical protein
VGLPAVAFFDEFDFTELTQAPEGMVNLPLGDGEGLGLVDELNERLGCKKAPVVPECLPDEFHYRLLPVPVYFSFEGICSRRDWESRAVFGLGRNVVCGGDGPEQAVNGVDSGSPFGSARSQVCVTLPLEPFPSR